jgi:hypothetical protein
MSSFLNRPLISLLVFLISLPPLPVGAQGGDIPLKPEEIDQLAAPVALYPDPLLSQIFMASTYPLEVVQANRWAKQNQNLKGDAMAQALEKQDWDPSVRSLVNFPDVLSNMSDKLDWTQKLGDAFLSQQKDVMDAVQRLRAKAQAAGNLNTTEQQKVIVEEKIIEIEPASPQVIYVPTYDPTVIYGTWPYPAYPPYPWYPPGYVFRSLFVFGVGIGLGIAWGYAWGSCNWRRGDVNINVNQNVNFNRNINRAEFSQKIGQSGQGQWKHDVSHRKGVSYRDDATAQKFGQGSSNQVIQAREAFRGREDAGGQELTRDGGGVGERGQPGGQGLGDRGGQGAADRGVSLGNRGGQGVGGGGGIGGLGGGGSSAFQGIGNGAQTRNYSNRGASSRGSGGFGGGGRAGGGARGGGGRRR